MIALDTNVLVRLVMADDPAQAGRARGLFEAHADADGSLFVSDVVLAEFAWVLKSRYALPREAIARARRAAGQLDAGLAVARCSHRGFARLRAWQRRFSRLPGGDAR